MSSQPLPPPTSLTPPPPPPQTTGPTATWGADHLDRAPTAEEIKAQAIKQAQAQAEARQAQDVSVTEAVKMIKPADFLGVYQTPCARTGLLSGIGGGAVVGMLRYILGGECSISLGRKYPRSIIYREKETNGQPRFPRRQTGPWGSLQQAVSCRTRCARQRGGQSGSRCSGLSRCTTASRQR